MGNYFSDAVELSLRYLFYEMSSGRGQEAFQLQAMEMPQPCLHDAFAAISTCGADMAFQRTTDRRLT